LGHNNSPEVFHNKCPTGDRISAHAERREVGSSGCVFKRLAFESGTAGNGGCDVQDSCLNGWVVRLDLVHEGGEVGDPRQEVVPLVKKEI
jgi:hypothetical protein